MAGPVIANTYIDSEEITQTGKLEYQICTIIVIKSTHLLVKQACSSNILWPKVNTVIVLYCSDNVRHFKAL